MNRSINKETKLFCSFSGSAGSFGCWLHNTGYEKLGINAIYKSFSVTSIQKAIESMKTLKIEGAAVSMPYKREAILYVDHLTPIAEEIGAVNTLYLVDDKVIGHNTDYRWMQKFKKTNRIVILGRGGFSRAMQYALRKENYPFEIIDRRNWDSLEELENCDVVNCTPVKGLKLPKVNFYDCDIETDTGKDMAIESGLEQFRLYTGESLSREDLGT